MLLCCCLIDLVTMFLLIVGKIHTSGLNRMKRTLKRALTAEMEFHSDSSSSEEEIRAHKGSVYQILEVCSIPKKKIYIMISREKLKPQKK